MQRQFLDPSLPSVYCVALCVVGWWRMRNAVCSTSDVLYLISFSCRVFCVQCGRDVRDSYSCSHALLNCSSWLFIHFRKLQRLLGRPLHVVSSLSSL